MEAKYLAEEVLVHPNHSLTFCDWIPTCREWARCFFVFFGEMVQGWRKVDVSIKMLNLYDLYNLCIHTIL